MQRDPRVNRRQFVRTATAGAALFTIVPRTALASADAPGANDKLNIAGVGVGGQGWGVLQQFRNENIVALCDVDDQRAGAAFEALPDARRFRDFRKMFDEMESQIDAVVVGTPDHTHAVICMEAMKRKKHVFCEKPLAHTIHEIRRLMDTARESGVVTQLGNQGHSSPSIRMFCEWIWDGAIGQVQEVHACCDAYRDAGEKDRHCSIFLDRSEPRRVKNVWGEGLGPEPIWRGTWVVRFA